MFPLIQLPRKSEAFLGWLGPRPLCPRFPLIQLPRKSEVLSPGSEATVTRLFPLIQLPRKSEEALLANPVNTMNKVSINSTSEEVRSLTIR